MDTTPYQIVIAKPKKSKCAHCFVFAYNQCK
jgi:hypothetical protein